MNNDPIYELELLGVFDARIPFKERIVLKATVRVDISSFAVAAGYRTSSQTAIPMRDHFMWLGNQILEAGDWLFLYTSTGNGSVNPIPNSNNKLYIGHWQREHTVFNSPLIVPLLFRLGGLIIEAAPNHLPDNSPLEQKTLPSR